MGDYTWFDEVINKQLVQQGVRYSCLSLLQQNANVKRRVVFRSRLGSRCWVQSEAFVLQIDQSARVSALPFNIAPREAVISGRKLSCRDQRTQIEGPDRA